MLVRFWLLISREIQRKCQNLGDIIHWRPPLQILGACPPVHPKFTPLTLMYGVKYKQVDGENLPTLPGAPMQPHVLNNITCLLLSSCLELLSGRHKNKLGHKHVTNSSEWTFDDDVGFKVAGMSMMIRRKKKYCCFRKHGQKNRVGRSFFLQWCF